MKRNIITFGEVLVGIALILAWRVAGSYGLDSYILPWLGTPWTGSLAHKPTPGKAVPPKESVVAS